MIFKPSKEAFQNSTVSLAHSFQSFLSHRSDGKETKKMSLDKTTSVQLTKTL